MTESEGSLENACRRGNADELVEKYIELCRKESDGDGKGRSKGRFPNLAGFCRYLGIGESELLRLSAKFPSELERVRAALEDEALNSDVSPTIISAYLKRRLGYEKAPESEVYDGQLKVVFEHDIMEDGK
ncbi:MAG: hypothetical protein E7641_05095 [Ruminococcaceae bacterium]|nr:hypothetical protein [Oscillospiraceae bacterium]